MVIFMLRFFANHYGIYFGKKIPPVLYLNTSGGNISFFLVSFLRVSTGYGNSVSHSSGYCMCQTQLINLYNIFQ